MWKLHEIIIFKLLKYWILKLLNNITWTEMKAKCNILNKKRQKHLKLLKLKPDNIKNLMKKSNWNRLKGKSYINN